ncbi:hypothetical protein BACCIP111895_00842 [Neobacillus rhizosphaerae]|uniref:ABC transporter permease n=1 Tax=Neobacillus rhizosphaerae TaxID=2880965 RepID=A0ABN8KJR4_9BACI|nr:ABC transporter permease [Neobacillus rhizosphaerae]CAH2713688.1 hypothetical protein BACCIP111895_00842 [Neobacillus rhizosphaerae]
MLNSKTVFLIEWKKIIKRKEILALFSMLAIPMLYSLGAYFNSSIIVFNSDTKEYGFSFLVNMIVFVKMLFIYFLITALFAAKSLGGEIENRSILLYTQRITDRAKIYKAKIAGLYSVVALITVFFMIFSIVMYYLFTVKREDIATAQFIKPDEFLGLLYVSIGIVLLYFLVISFSMMLSTFLKSNTAIIIFCVVFIAFTFLGKFPVVKYISFEYYLNGLMSITPTDHTQLTINFILYTLLVGGFIVICNIIGIRSFSRRDL